MQKQVDSSHYDFKKYVSKQRWASYWHQLDEVVRLNPSHVLEIGPGPGFFKAAAGALGLVVETLDLDPELKPDHLASVFDMPFENKKFDVVCAFQMLEHLPFEKSMIAFREMVRIANKAVVISLPDAATRWPILIRLPKFGVINLSIPRPGIWAPVHKFDGEHYWEINKAGYLLGFVIRELCKNNSVSLIRTFRVPEIPYHRFLIFNVGGCGR